MKKKFGVFVFAVIILLLLTVLIFKENKNFVGDIIKKFPKGEISKDSDVIIKSPSPPLTQSKIVVGSNGFRMTVDYDKDVFVINGKEYPIITDEIIVNDGQNIKINPSEDDVRQVQSSGVASFTNKSYSRFNVYVNDSFYNTNQTMFDDFLDKFETRLIMMENETGWSSEKFYGKKLDLYIEPTTGCYGGYALPGEAHIYLSDPFPNFLCLKAYYEGGEPLMNNPGELGDNWVYMTTALHESLHSINPLPIMARSWLTEGFSEYNMYNIPVEKGDINKKTADTYIFRGYPAWNWQSYIANDYRDTAGSNLEIQESYASDITGWMFSMLRDKYNLNFSRFYYLVNSNLETLDKTQEIGWYQADMAVIDLFGRALGHTSFDNQTKPIFRYDGPNGPGWGVRQWVSRSFYGDLRAVVTIPKRTYYQGETISLAASIYNNGRFEFSDVPVKIYFGQKLIYDQKVNIPLEFNSPTTILKNITSVGGSYTIKIVVDSDNIKLESNESNNIAEIKINVLAAGCSWQKVNGSYQVVCPNQQMQNTGSGSS